MLICDCGHALPDDRERCDQCGRWRWWVIEQREREALKPVPAEPTPVPVLVKPTRAQIMAVRADGWYTPDLQQGPSPWATYGYAIWDDAKRAEARALWTRIGMTHVAPTWCLDYPSSGFPAFDFRTETNAFRERLRELKKDGFIIALPLSQEEAYGKYDGYRLTQNLADIRLWQTWGWSKYVDIAWPGWESNDFMTASAQIEVLRQARTVLGPDVMLAVQPGRSPTEPRFWSADDTYPEPYDRDGWIGQMHDARIALDLFFAEPSMAAFEGDQWRERFYSELMGLSARLYRRIDPVPDVYPFPPHRDCLSEHEGWTRCAPIQGGGVPLVYFEGPAWARWPSSRKAEASRIAMLVPGVIGYGDGMP